MGVRKATNRGRGLNGMFPSFKMPGHTIRYESSIERDLCFVLEFDSSVCSYAAHPFCITHPDSNGRVCSYTPDFWVVHTTGQRDVVECTPAALITDPHTQQQMTIGQAWAAANKCTFVVVTDADVRQGHTLANIKLLWRYRQLAVAYDLIARTVAYVRQYPGATIRDTVAYVTENPHPPAHHPFLYHLVFHHILMTDLTHPLSLQSCLWLPYQPQQEE
jgi:hypothetical protein